MGKPLSMDLRERVVGAISGGMSRRAAAERFGVSAASAVRWAALQREHGKPAAKPQGATPARRRPRPRRCGYERCTRLAPTSLLPNCARRWLPRGS